MASIPSIRVRRKLSTPACDHLVPMQLSSWLYFFRSGVTAVAGNAIKRRHEPQAWCNTSMVVSLAFKTLKHSRFTLVINDKDGGWSIAPKEDLQSLHEETLRGAIYREVSPLAVLQQSMLDTYAVICKGIASFEESPGLRSVLMKSTIGGGIQASLSLSIKSHKDDGLVKCRAIHGGKPYSFAGASKWIISKLRPILSRRRTSLLIRNPLLTS
jgi:hypothetical protein